MELNLFAVEILGERARYFLTRSGAERGEGFGEMKEFEDRHSPLSFYLTSSLEQANSVLKKLTEAGVSAKVVEVFATLQRAEVKV